MNPDPELADQLPPRVKFFIYNPYPCVKADCKGTMYSYEPGTAVCGVCKTRAGDCSKMTEAGSGAFDFIHCGPKGWKTAREVVEGMAGKKPDPANDPFAKAMRASIVARKNADEEGQKRGVDQRTALAERQQVARDAADEKREFGVRAHKTAAQKIARLARAQFEAE